jgi:hypothetical protein
LIFFSGKLFSWWKTLPLADAPDIYAGIIQQQKRAPAAAGALVVKRKASRQNACWPRFNIYLFQ